MQDLMAPIQYEVDSAALRAATWYAWLRDVRFQIPVGLGVLLSLGAAALGVYRHTRDLNSAQVIWFVFEVLGGLMNLCAFLTLLLGLAAAAVWVRSWLRSSLKGPASLTLEDSGLQVDSAEGNRHYPWDSIRGLTLTDQHLLVAAADGKVHAVPRRADNEASLLSLRDKIRERIKASKPGS